jgi:hypothetical protein
MPLWLGNLSSEQHNACIFRVQLSQVWKVVDYTEVKVETGSGG